MSEQVFIDEARQQAAQCWCDDETKDRVMDPALCEAFAKRIAAWMDTAAQAYRGIDFYRGIITQIGEKSGKPAYTSDDGSVQQDVLALRVPELVNSMRDELRERVGVAVLLLGLLQGVVAVVGMTAFKHESQRAVLQEVVDSATAAIKECKAKFKYEEYFKGK